MISALAIDCPAAFKASLFKPDTVLPLIIQANTDCSLHQLQQWMMQQQSWLEEALLRHGGILFRGFPVQTAGEFEQLVTTLAPTLVPYIQGHSPRSRVHNLIYTSTEYPATQSIVLHNELSYTAEAPRKVFFFCQTPPTTGGETPIVSSRLVYERLDPEMRDRFAQKQIRYIKNMHSKAWSNLMGKSWQDQFETQDRSGVERYLSNAGIDFCWREDGTLHMQQIGRAIVSHPQTGETVWHGQPHLFHYSTYGAVGASLCRLLGEENLPLHSYYGDGTPISSHDIAVLRDLHLQHATLFAWQRGDVLMLDNYLVAHGRQPYTGDRRILAALAA